MGMLSLLGCQVTLAEAWRVLKWVGKVIPWPGHLLWSRRPLLVVGVLSFVLQSFLAKTSEYLAWRLGIVDSQDLQTRPRIYWGHQVRHCCIPSTGPVHGSEDHDYSLVFLGTCSLTLKYRGCVECPWDQPGLTFWFNLLHFVILIIHTLPPKKMLEAMF